MSAELKVAVALFGLLLTASCASTDAITDIRPGQLPAANTDEAGLWMVFDRAESELQTSGRIVQDPVVGAYVHSIVCNLSPEHCDHIRTYVVRSAKFNASMAPNGVMHVWTGLLLRAENEAQVAFVIGHELAHYTKRHSLKRWRDLRAKTTGLAFFQVATAAAGVGVVGDVATLGTIVSVYSFSRDQEREADKLGLRMMADAGYDPREAVKIWKTLIEEKEASSDPDRSIFFSTHPSTEERIESLAEMAGAQQGGAQRLRRDEFLAVVEPFRSRWISDEFRYRDYGMLEALLDHQAKTSASPGLVQFFRGEFFRLRRDEGDDAKALTAYQSAVEDGGAPAEAFRSLGLVHWARGDTEQARQAFERYLTEEPLAEDRAMIESYLERI